MKINYLSHLALAAVVLMGSWTLFGQDRSRIARSDQPERFQVTSSNGTVIMIETQTGQSWTYIDSTGVTTLPVWIPIQRLDSRDEVEKWQKDIQTRKSTRPEPVAPRRYNSEPENVPTFEPQQPGPSLTPTSPSRYVPEPSELPDDDAYAPAPPRKVTPQPPAYTPRKPIDRNPNRSPKGDVPLPDDETP